MEGGHLFERGKTLARLTVRAHIAISVPVDTWTAIWSIGVEALNTALKTLAGKRLAKPGQLYRISTCFSVMYIGQRTIWLRPSPLNKLGASERVYKISTSFYSENWTGGTFLVLKVQEDKPLWNQWVQVLFTKTNSQELAIGWLLFSEFYQLVTPNK